MKEANDELCSGCFSSHFPNPNMKICKANRDKKLKKFNPVGTYRLMGGADYEADDQEPSLIITRAISNAKEHGISIHAGVKNLANGNCAFESIIDSINTRVSFLEE